MSALLGLRASLALRVTQARKGRRESKVRLALLVLLALLEQQVQLGLRASKVFLVQ